MRKISLAFLALLFALVPTEAQVPGFPQTLPPNTVVGRLGISAGPAQAIPFATLTNNLLSVLGCTVTGQAMVWNNTTASWGCSPNGVVMVDAAAGPAAFNGRIGIGTQNPQAQMEISNSGSSTGWAYGAPNAGLMITGVEENSANFTTQAIGTGGQTLVEWLWYRARGTRTAPTDLKSGDTIGQWQVAGRSTDPAGFNLGANLSVVTSADWTASSTPAQYNFTTTRPGTVIPARSLTITSSGGISVGNTTVDPGDGVINALTGFRVANVATAGTVLRGNGTNFVASVPTVLSTLTYSTSITPDAPVGDIFVITATKATAFTINAPTNPSTGMTRRFTIRNTSGGALGAITWNAVFKMPAFTSPANANSRTVQFHYDGTNWIQNWQSAADVPN